MNMGMLPQTDSQLQHCSFSLVNEWDANGEKKMKNIWGWTFGNAIRSTAIEKLKELPEIHRDPFDRLLIAQALDAGFALVTRDKIIPQYPLQTIW